eukprot:2532857-Pyramimonas_sp.AAC.1
MCIRDSGALKAEESARPNERIARDSLTAWPRTGKDTPGGSSVGCAHATPATLQRSWASLGMRREYEWV